MKKKLLFFMIAAMMLFGNIAFASSSYTAITRSMVGADGAEYKMSGKLYMDGINESSSTNDLYVEAYRSLLGPDPNVRSFLLKSGKAASTTFVVPNGYYYVHLDPAGPYARGCDGYGLLRPN
jgi:hypothetical protein